MTKASFLLVFLLAGSLAYAGPMDPPSTLLYYQVQISGITFTAEDCITSVCTETIDLSFDFYQSPVTQMYQTPTQYGAVPDSVILNAQGVLGPLTFGGVYNDGGFFIELFTTYGSGPGGRDEIDIYPPAPGGPVLFPTGIQTVQSDMYSCNSDECRSAFPNGGRNMSPHTTGTAVVIAMPEDGSTLLYLLVNLLTLALACWVWKGGHRQLRFRMSTTTPGRSRFLR